MSHALASPKLCGTADVKSWTPAQRFHSNIIIMRSCNGFLFTIGPHHGNETTPKTEHDNIIGRRTQFEFHVCLQR